VRDIKTETYVMQHAASQSSVYKMLITGRTKTLVTVNPNIQHRNPQQRNLDKIKGKATPLQAWAGPEGNGNLRLPDFKKIGT